jgi:hypothetical protein
VRRPSKLILLEQIAQSLIGTVRLLLYGPDCRGSRASDIFKAQLIYFQHRQNLALTLWQRRDEFMESGKIILPIPDDWVFRQHVDRALSRPDALALAIVVHSHAPGNRVNPWEQRLASAVRVAHAMNSQPRILQHIVSIGGTAHLPREKPVKLRAEQLD